MKTTIYNPSPLETEIATALMNLQNEIEKQLNNKRISSITTNTLQDNPSVKINLVDNDGDHHEVILKVVQIPDKI